MYIYIYVYYICYTIYTILYTIRYLQNTCKHMDQPPPGPCAWSSREGGPVAWRWLVAWCSCQATIPIAWWREGAVELWFLNVPYSLGAKDHQGPSSQHNDGWDCWNDILQLIFWESWTWTLAPLEIGACQTSFLLPLLGFFQRLSLIWWIIAYYTYMMPCASIFWYFQCFLGWDGWKRPHNNIPKVVSFLWGGAGDPQALRFEFGRKTWSEDRRGQDRRDIVTITIQLGPPGSSLRLQCYRCLFLAFQSLGKQWSNRHNTNDRNYIDRRGLSLHNHILLHNQKSLHNCTTCSNFSSMAFTLPFMLTAPKNWPARSQSNWKVTHHRPGS